MGGICSSGNHVQDEAQDDEPEVVEYAVGGYFGEDSMLHGNPYPRTVRALGHTSVLMLSNEVLVRMCNSESLENIAQKQEELKRQSPDHSIEEPEEPIKKPTNARKRGSITAGTIEVKKDWVPPKYEHTPEEIERLKAFFEKTMLLSSLDSNRRETLIGAFQLKDFGNGVEIITQGAEGDFYYILDSGSADVFVSKDGAPAQKVLDYGPGGAFGELALMHTEKRQATVKSTSPCVCWALDRETFHRVMIVGGRQEMVERERLAGKVPVLQALTNFERFRVVEALLMKEFKDSEIIVQAGSTGRDLFIIRSGRAEGFKPDDR